MRYGSVCSGIEAATVAWHPLGWEPAFFSEIEAFPRAVLQHHYPHVPLHGDFTTIKENDYDPIDLLCGGTPCQSFSIAGLRAGLADARGNLSLEFIRLAARLKPRWVVWENVPGVLSSFSDSKPPGGLEEGEEWEAEEESAFGCFLAGLAECGYGFAYRVLDAQYFGVPQRRRRVVVVGYLGDWRPPEAVLFESESLRGDITPSRETRKEIAGAITAGAFSGGAGGRPEGAAGNHFVAEGVEVGPSGVNYTKTSSTLDARCKDGPIRNQLGMMVAHTLLGKGNDSHAADLETYIPEVASTLEITCHDYSRADGFNMVAHAFKVRGGCEGGGKGYLGQDDCAFTVTTGHDQNIAQPIPINTQIAMRHERLGEGTGLGVGEEGDPAYTLQANHHHAVASPIGFPARMSGTQCAASVDVSPSLCAANPMGVSHPIAWDEELNAKVDMSGAVIRGGDGGRHAGVMTTKMAVRRLTPRECERLQGFPDDFTMVPFCGKPAADGPRYKAIGNSWAVPKFAWLGERIQMVDEIIKGAA